MSIVKVILRDIKKRCEEVRERKIVTDFWAKKVNDGFR